MKGAARIVISSRPGEVRGAALDADGTPQEFRVLRTARPSLLGGVYLGRVRAVRLDIKAAFVDIGADKEGFLNLKSSHGDTVREGAAMTVQVDRDAVADKGPRLTTHIPDAPAVPAEGEPPMRLTEPWPAARQLLIGWLGSETGLVIADDAAIQAMVPGPVRFERTPLGTDAFASQDLDDAFWAALSPSLSLPSGGRLHFAETPAMTTVDVDAGAATASPLAVNLEAAAAIAREVRLRGIGGLIAVDFLRMKGGRQQADVMTALKDALADDPAQPKAAGFSPFGLVEIQRRRTGPSLAETMLTRKLDKSPETVAIEALSELVRIGGSQATLHTSSAVAGALKGDLAAARAEAEARLGFDIRIESDLHMASENGYEIEQG